MRKVRFSLSDRLVLTPIEIVGAVTHWAFLAVLGLWLLRRIGIAVPSVDAPAVLGAILVGAVAVPALLPWIPGRAFALKGGILGLIWAAAVCLSNGWHPATVAGWAAGLSYLLILPALSAFIAMNFTGSTPITSLSGVIKEMRTAVPLMIIAAVLGVAAMVVAAVVRT